MVATIAVYFIPKFLPDSASPTRLAGPRPSPGRSVSGDSSDIGQFSFHGAGRRGGVRGGLQRQGSLRLETPPTNRFLRFLTGISNITTYDHDESSAHAIDGNKPGAKDEEDPEESSRLPTSETPDKEVGSSQQRSSQESFADCSSNQTFECDTISDVGKDQEKNTVAVQYEETIALLREEITILRRRLVKKDKSESDESAKTQKN